MVQEPKHLKDLCDDSDRMGKLQERLTQHNDFVKSMVDLIPPNVYFGEDDSKKMATLKHNEVDAKLKGKAGKASIKMKLKMARLDPEMRKPVTKVMEELNNVTTDEESEEIEDEEPPQETEPKVKTSPKTGQVVKESKKRKKLHPGNSTTEKPDQKDKKQGTNKQNLKETLSKKIEELRSKRRTDEKYLEKIRNKRKEARGRRKKSILKQKGKKARGKNQTEKDAETSKYGEKYDKKVKKATEKQTKIAEEPQEIQFNPIKTSNKKRKNKFSGKNYSEILKNLKFREKKINKLGEMDQGKADKVKENFRWRTALDRAEGVKVKDDTDKLKAALKRKQDKKKKSQKEWAERQKQQQLGKEKKQKKRTDNIQKRKNAKKEGQINKAKKKGRFIQNF